MDTQKRIRQGVSRKSVSYPAGLGLLALVAVLVALSLGGNTDAAAPSGSPAELSHPVAPAKGQSWVVVELFTSQGCSSCPAADRLLAPLAAGRLAGPGVLPLAFHVDYWDYIGWPDPFASPIWTDRQRTYARESFETSRIYTPQAVVQGTGDCVGSNRDCLRKAIDEARRLPGRIALDGSVEASTGELEVRVEGRSIAGSSPVEKPRIWLALYEIGLRTPIGAGENSGRRLEEEFVVRRFVDLGAMVSTGSESSFEKSARLEVEGDWKRANLGVVVLAQDGPGGPIVGSALLAAGL